MVRPARSHFAAMNDDPVLHEYQQFASRTGPY